MATKNLNAIILSRKNYGEADKLIFAFSREEGKIKIKAKGCRKINSKLASQIEQFCIGKYYLAEGKGNYVLAGSDNVLPNTHITRNIEVYKDASYVCELLQLAFEDAVPNKYIYDLTEDILKLLDGLGQDKRKILLRYYEFKLLSEMGYRPNYSVCKKCGQALEKKDAYFGNFEGVFCNNCQMKGKKISLNALKTLRLFNDSSLKKILNVKGIEKYNSDIKDVTFDYLCDILPKTPKAEDL